MWAQALSHTAVKITASILREHILVQYTDLWFAEPNGFDSQTGESHLLFCR